MANLTKEQQKIIESYDIHDNGHISTEQLFARVCDDCDCDNGEIVDALVASGRLQKAKTT